MTYVPEPYVNRKEQFRQLLEAAVGKPGDIAEFGVYRGGNSYILSQLAPERLVYSFDTFAGMPAEDFSESNGDHDTPGSFTPESECLPFLRTIPNIRPMVGRFVNTLPLVPEDTKFILVYMDCDLYASYKQVLEWLPPHLADGATIVIDDYGVCKGARWACDEFFSAHKDLTMERDAVPWKSSTNNKD